MQQLAEVALDAIRPPPKLTISELADKHRVLGPSEGRPGPWETSRTPYLREIMDACGLDDPATHVVFAKGSQIGGTECQINAMLAWMIHSACRIVYARPSKDECRSFVEERLKPAIDHCKEARERFPKGRMKASKQVNRFRGGTLKWVGAEVAADLRSTPVERILADEIDNWPADVEGEGDPLYLLEKRQGTYPQRKLVIVSTPNVHEQSRVELRYLEGDRRTYWVPCLECGEYQVLEFRNLAIPNGDDGLKDPDAAYMHCAINGCVWEETDKREMLARGEWRREQDLNPDQTRAARRAVGIDKDPRADKIKPRKGVKSFHLSSLYSPVGWLSWVDIAHEWVIAQRDLTKLKAFVNTVLGQTWKGDAGERVNDHALYKRREDWTAEDIAQRLPPGILQITMGVDVQGDRLEAEIIGWGVGYESWSLDYLVIPGSPTGKAVWRTLDRVRLRRFRTEDGRTLAIEAVGVDSNYEAHHVHMYTRSRWDDRVYSLKGSSTPGAAIWPTGWSKSKYKDVRIKVVGVNRAKEHVYDWLMRQDPGPGFAHFPADREHWYFEGLTVERRFYKHTKGYRVTIWEKPPNAANEPLDTRVYAYAVLLGLEKLGRRLTTLAKQRDRPRHKPEPKPAVDPEPETAQARRRQPERRTYRGDRKRNWFKDR